MPVSLLTSSSGGKRIVHRSESNRSDKSDVSVLSSEGGSSKKVSFNKAVRVKKYSTPPISPVDIPENKFWFRVYKTHQYKPESGDSAATQFDEPKDECSEQKAKVLSKQQTVVSRPLSTIIESGASASPTSTSTTSDMNRKSYAASEKSVKSTRSNKSNKSDRNGLGNNFHIHRCSAQREPQANGKVEIEFEHPKEPEVDYNDVFYQRAQASEKQSAKRNPLVNGVKVIFGMSPTMPKKGKSGSAKVEQAQPVRDHRSSSEKLEKLLRLTSTTSPAQSYASPSRSANQADLKLDDSFGSDKKDGSVMSASKGYIKKYQPSIGSVDNESIRSNGVGKEVAVRVEEDSDEEYDPIKDLNTVTVWESGPMLMADKKDYQKSLAEMPGEGKIFSTREEGSQVWKTKTRTRRVEVVPKIRDEREDKRLTGRTVRPIPSAKTNPNPNTNTKAIEYKRDTSVKKRGTPVDEKITAEDIDRILLESPNPIESSYSYSYVPLVRDVGIQCNRKKTNRHLNTSSDSSYRVIKSSDNGMVSAYSDVPSLKAHLVPETPVLKHQLWNNEKTTNKNEVIYSQVDKKKRVDKDLTEHHRVNTPQYQVMNYGNGSDYYNSLPKDKRLNKNYHQDAAYSTNSQTRIIKNKTKGLGFNMSSGFDGPEINLPETPTLKRSKNRPTPYYYDSSDDMPRTSTLKSEKNRPVDYRKEVKEEVLEETISISNASSDDMMQQHTDIDEILAPKSVIREYDHKKKELSYENVSPNQRQMVNRDIYEGKTTHGGGLWYRDIDEDYRRGMAQSEVSYPAGNEPSFLTLSRFESKGGKPTPRDFSPPPRQAFTLDRKYLNERAKKKAEKEGEMRLLMHRPMHESERCRSDANLLGYPSIPTYGDYRSGLATAYKARQEQRSSSLNRINSNRMDTSPLKHRYLSSSHLGSAGNSAQSSSDSDTAHGRRSAGYIHDRDPIVMYIPAVSHQDKRADDSSDRLSGILRTSSAASKRSNKPSKKGPKMTSASSDIAAIKTRVPVQSTSRSRNQEEERDQVSELIDTKTLGKKKKGASKAVNRRHSIPKDTKFPWLQRLKIKVKSRDS